MKATHYSAPDPDPEGRALVSLETERGVAGGRGLSGWCSRADSQPGTGTGQEAGCLCPLTASPAPNCVQTVTSADQLLPLVYRKLPPQEPPPASSDLSHTRAPERSDLGWTQRLQ